MGNERTHASQVPNPRHIAASYGPIEAGPEELIGQIQNLMWKGVGIVRTGTGLQRAIHHLEKLQPRLVNPHTRRAFRATNLLTAALMVARSALAREDSRGAHYRMDHPFPNDARFLKHSLVKGGAIQFA